MPESVDPVRIVVPCIEEHMRLFRGEKKNGCVCSEKLTCLHCTWELVRIGQMSADGALLRQQRWMRFCITCTEPIPAYYLNI